LLLHLRQHLYTDLCKSTCTCGVRFHQPLIIFQTLLVHGQSLHKCRGLLCSMLHSLHNGSLGHPLFCKLSAVRILLCNKVHAKNLHFGSAFAFQIALSKYPRSDMAFSHSSIKYKKIRLELAQKSSLEVPLE
jgi:hypothetical protein